MLNKLRDSFYRFMYGRYGYDEFGRMLLYSTIVLCVVNIFIKNTVIYFVLWFVLIYDSYRAFSKNIGARRKENDRYLYIVKPWKLKWQYKGTHKVFRCRNCGQILRVPKGKGQIDITCPKCKVVVTKRT